MIALQVNSTGFVRSGDVIKVKAVYVQRHKIRCELPDGATSYRLQLSNNGVKLSVTAILVLNFDLDCYACDAQEGSCTRSVSRAENTLKPN